MAKADKNLYYGRDFGHNNNDIYNLILLDIIKNKTTTHEYITEYIRLLLNMGYSIDNLLVMWKITEYAYATDNSTICYKVSGIDYNIYIYMIQLLM